MDYYQGVVTEYLRADRSLFVNTECCIQINRGENPDTSGPHWYCDAVAINPGARAIFLCEVSYSQSLQGLIERLEAWNVHWEGVRTALVRDSHLPAEWSVRPWLFIPEHLVGKLTKGLAKIKGTNRRLSFEPIVTTLEMVQPWEYRAWSRSKEEPKPECIPIEMQS